MSIVLEIARDKPIGFWSLDAGFTDRSGYGRTAGMVSGTADRHAALANGLSYASVFNNTARAQFNFPTFTQGKEQKSFTMEAFVRPIEPTPVSGESQILGHLDTYDGLVIDGLTVSFVTKYLTSGEARASYTLSKLQALHLVGVHTKEKNSLYINGNLVAEVDIAEFQQADTYVVAGETAYSGQSTTSRRLALNAVALYNYPISPESVVRHAAVGRDLPDTEDVSESFGGDTIHFLPARGDVFLQHVIDEVDEWSAGTSSGLQYDNGILSPVMNEDISEPGFWLGVFPMSFAETTSIYGVQFDWDGNGATLQVSLDDTTWVTVNKGEFAPNVPPGFDPTDTDLSLRFTFPGDIQNDTSYVANFTVTGYFNSTVDSGDRKVTKIGNIIVGEDRLPIEYADGWGLKTNGGALQISTPDDGSGNPQTIELWVKNLVDAPGTLVDARTASSTTSAYFGRTGANYTVNGTLYVNGAVQASGYSWKVGEWTLIHIVNTNTAGTTINLGQSNTGAVRGQYEIGNVSFYPAALTAAEVSAIYNTYTGGNSVRIGDNSIISIAESPTAASIYAYDWSIQSAG